ncbi:glycosyltransferase family 2 protein [Acidobacterium sp. S8]|uniref:glycosyltransferase family 2 protein n=1 Tax=Acidobacterium sp. S8 TaxID=1641854 RepID=UPI00131CF8B4|nr:glycosyltransferase family 2 protein [Acidobacterium sp. S8]
MTYQQPHISVCICTYKRPELLRRALEAACMQRKDDLFTFTIVVVDNDKNESGREIAAQMALECRVPINYVVEARQGIALARNKAVESATGNFVAFMDDDELPIQEWLLTLFKTLQGCEADGVLGPVDPHFDEDTPQWIIEGGFYSRPSHPTGMKLAWRNCRTGNVLLKRELFATDEQPFNPECLSGEDQDFFRRKIEKGHQFIWCHEATIYEVVPAVRWKRSFLIRRALFRGIFAQRNHGLQPLRLLQAVVSAPVYALALPIAFIFGQAKFMTCVFKLSYHMGRLFAVVGLNPIRQRYVTE